MSVDTTNEPDQLEGIPDRLAVVAQYDNENILSARE